MGALFGQKPKTSVVQQDVPQPQETATPTEVGKARKVEDQALFGSSTPDLRVDRPTDTTGAVTTAGSGLKLM